MGPITGFRIINLRVRDKVSYRDLTVDLSGDGHVVIGLENGGGKSTLLGFLIHTFLPHAEKFLPRLAHRRQDKQGEEKRIEHYVPGGAPTHVIVELLLPEAGRRRIGRPARVLVGVCLSKPAGAPASAPVEEFFWSARCVSDDLTLTNLGVRAGDGRLVDEGEWWDRLATARKAHPDAEIVMERRQRSWDQHLRDTLKIDVDFVRTWLLAMNQDEGAADRVFTYSSSRDFLHSLINAVADPQHVASLKATLADIGRDADAMSLDRQREVVLRRLVEQTSQLADMTQQLSEVDTQRTVLVDTLLTARRGIASTQTDAADHAQRAAEMRDAAVEAAQQARIEHHDAVRDELLGRRQLTTLRRAHVQQQLHATQDAVAASEHRENRALAAAVLVKLRATHDRITDIQVQLENKSATAEPARLAASAALRAWRASLDHAITARIADRDRLSQQRQAAEDAETAANTTLRDLERDVGRHQSDIAHTQERLSELDALLTRAIDTGDLTSGTPVDTALADVAHEIERLREEAADAEQRRAQHDAVVRELDQQRPGLERDIALAERDVTSCTKERKQVNDRTDALADELTDSGLLDWEPIRLDDHAGLMEEALRAVAATADSRHVAAAVEAAAARRAKDALDTTKLLPPRTDVEKICQQGTTLGIRPGWSYLAAIRDDEVATQLASAHPALSDGIVVNVPEDLADTISLVQRHRDILTGPITIGLVDAFHQPGTDTADTEDIADTDMASADRPAPDADTTNRAGARTDARTTVVLPHQGHWSYAAANSHRGQVDDLHDHAQNEVDRETATAQQARRLADKIAAWRHDIGPGGCEQTARALAAAEQRHASAIQQRITLNEQHTAHSTSLDHANRDAQRIEQQLTASRARHDRLQSLRQRLAERPRFEQQLQELWALLDTTQRSQDAATAAHTQAKLDQRSLTDQLTEVETDLTDLRGDHDDAAARCAATCRDSDATTDTTDTAAEVGLATDRESLAQRAIALVDRWNGLVTDADLSAQLKHNQEQVRELEHQRGRYEHDTLHAAHALIEADPARTVDDHHRDARDEQRSRAPLHETIGQHNGALQTLDTELTTIARDCAEHGTRELPEHHQTSDLDQAGEIAATLQARVRVTDAARQDTSARERAATDAVRHAHGWLDAIRRAHVMVDHQLSKVCSAGQILRPIDPDDREFDLPRETPLAFPRVLSETLSALAQRRSAPETVGGLLDRCQDDIAGSVSALRRTIDTTEQAVDKRLQRVEEVVHSADDKVAKGDSLIQTLRHTPRPQLAERASTHHQDATERLHSVAHHVAKFDKRIESAGNIAFATIKALLRAVTDTVKTSQLPDTPSMGRWAGLPLLKLTGLDKLSKQHQQEAVLNTLKDWFDPNRDQRPAFDADKTIWELVAACVPTFTAKVLIPSDPLDPEHKPVDRLAVETSGGEGVTFALILASLLAARRALTHGHRKTTLLLDNPFSKVTKPAFLSLARDMAQSLCVNIVALTGVSDTRALRVFPALIQLRVSRRHTANVVVPADTDDNRLQQLLREGTLYVSATEQLTAAAEAHGDADVWPVISMAEIHWAEQIDMFDTPESATPESAPESTATDSAAIPAAVVVDHPAEIAVEQYAVEQSEDA